jgi:CBS domain-containing protein
VVLDGEKLVGYITQSDLVKHLSEQGKFSDQTLKELQIGSDKITTITESQKVLEAFRDMAVNRCSACAVVDGEGKLVSNISSLDIRVCLF